MKSPADKLADIVAIQCSDGNWNYDPYMQGMANGLILAQAILTDTDPQFLSAPAEWLHDKPSEAPVEADA